MSSICITNPNQWDILPEDSRISCGNSVTNEIPQFGKIECQPTVHEYDNAGQALVCKITYEEAGIDPWETVACKTDQQHLKHEEQICRFFTSTDLWHDKHPQNLLFRAFTKKGTKNTPKAGSVLMIPDHGFGACKNDDSACPTDEWKYKATCQSNLEAFARDKETIRTRKDELAALKKERKPTELSVQIEKDKRKKQLIEEIAYLESKMKDERELLLANCFPDPSSKNMNGVGRLLYDMRRETAENTDDSTIENQVAYHTCRNMFNLYSKNEYKVLGNSQWKCIPDQLRDKYMLLSTPRQVSEFMNKHMDDIGSDWGGEDGNPNLVSLCQNVAKDLKLGAEAVLALWDNPAVTCKTESCRQAGLDTQPCSMLKPGAEDGQMLTDADVEIIPMRPTTKDDPDDVDKLKEIERLHNEFLDHALEDIKRLKATRDAVQQMCVTERLVSLGLFNAGCDSEENPGDCIKKYPCNDLLHIMDQKISEKENNDYDYDDYDF